MLLIYWRNKIPNKKLITALHCIKSLNSSYNILPSQEERSNQQKIYSVNCILVINTDCHKWPDLCQPEARITRPVFRFFSCQPTNKCALSIAVQHYSSTFTHSNSSLFTVQYVPYMLDMSPIDILTGTQVMDLQPGSTGHKLPGILSETPLILHDSPDSSAASNSRFFFVDKFSQISRPFWRRCQRLRRQYGNQSDQNFRELFRN